MNSLIMRRGDRYGLWTLMEEADKSARGMRQFLCACDCGTERIVQIGALRNGASQSCGCAPRKRKVPLKKRPEKLQFCGEFRKILGERGIRPTKLAALIGLNCHDVASFHCGHSIPSPQYLGLMLPHIGCSEDEARELYLALARDHGYQL